MYHVLLHFPDTAFLQIESLSEPCVKQIYGCHFSNSIWSFHVSVSRFGNSHYMSKFFTIVIVALVICNINVTVMTCWSLLCWLVLFFLNHCIVFRLRSVHCFLRPSAIAHLIGQCHVNINSACSGKSERSYDSLYCRVHFILVFWNCTHTEGWLYLFPFWKTGDCLFWKL